MKRTIKILVLHGLLHTYRSYIPLSNLLYRNAEVTLYRFNETYSNSKICREVSLDKLADNLASYLSKNKFDIIIGHSMGGAVLMRVLSNLRTLDSTIIFTNTPYNGIPKIKFISKFKKLVALSLFITKYLPRNSVKQIVKKLLRLPTKETKYFGYKVLSDILYIDPVNSAELLYQLANDKYCFKAENCRNSVIIVYSINDRIVSLDNTKKFIKDIKPKTVIRFDTGHTIPIEGENSFYGILSNEINNIMKGRKYSKCGCSKIS